MGSHRKDSPKYDGMNYENWKNKTRNHTIYIGFEYWLITKIKEDIKIKDELESSIQVERKKFSCKMVDREDLINTLS